jgi:WD40 repeat protein
VRVWDVTRGRELRCFDYTGVTILAWSPDGGQIAAADGVGMIRAWDVATGRKLWDSRYASLPSADGMPMPRMDFPVWISDMVWSPSGPLLATMGGDGDVCLWDAARGTEKLFLRGEQGVGPPATWSPDGRRIAAGGWDGRVWVWDLR